MSPFCYEHLILSSGFYKLFLLLLLLPPPLCVDDSEAVGGGRTLASFRDPLFLLLFRVSLRFSIFVPGFLGFVFLSTVSLDSGVTVLCTRAVYS